MAENSEGGCGTLIAIGLFICAVHSCASKSPEKIAQAEQAVVAGEAAEPTTLDGAIAAVNPVRGDFDEDRATEAAREALSGSYEGMMGSYSCTDDCSGHEAGWEWARNGNSCGQGESYSFDEGCRAFEAKVEEAADEARGRYDRGDDTFEQK